MRGPQKTFIAILLLTIAVFFIDLPTDIPLKFSIGSLSIDRTISTPHMYIPGIINKTFETRLGLDLKGGTQLVLDVDMKDIARESRDQALESAREIIERRVNFFGLSEPVVQSSRVGENYRIIVELPGVSDVDAAVGTIGQTARLEFRKFIDATPSAIPTIGTTDPTGLSGNDLKKAQLVFHSTTGEPVVEFTLGSDGAERFGEVTTELVGKPLVIFLDEVPLTWPIVSEPITGGSGIITGGFTKDQAKSLALQLSAGALPAPISVAEQRTIGASLGEVSIAKSIRAGIIGLLMVALFMVLSYGYLGFLAVLALAVYGLLSLAIFKAIPITLTLPGIAGFILSIGMAVDSNILIFERIKEEVRRGTPWHIAQELGFGHAWDSIRDANFTTLLTAFVLFNPLNLDFLPVSGAVRGFAVTLAVGVLTSLFTGIVVTRTFIRVLYWRKKV